VCALLCVSASASAAPAQHCGEPRLNSIKTERNRAIADQVAPEQVTAQPQFTVVKIKKREQEVIASVVAHAPELHSWTYAAAGQFFSAQVESEQTGAVRHIFRPGSSRHCPRWSTPPIAAPAERPRLN
jgi:hypothetical protein